MTATTIASRYSRALLKLAFSHNKLEDYLKSLQHLIHALNDSPALFKFLCSPVYSIKAQQNVLERLFIDKIDSSLLHFLFILLDHKRFALLKEIVAHYHIAVKKELGIIEAQVTTAIPLEETLREKLQHKLENLYQKKVEIQSIVSPTIMGGTILVIGHQIADDSIKTRLAKIKEDLLAVKLK